MDRVGCPNNLWVMCFLHVVYMFNHLAHPDLNWRTPIEACFGYTPDTSALLLFTFFQKIYYLASEIPFSSTKEKAGRFIGITESTGRPWPSGSWQKIQTNSLQGVLYAAQTIRQTPIKDWPKIQRPWYPDQRLKSLGPRSKDILKGGTLPVIDPG